MTEENNHSTPEYLKKHLLQITVDASLTSSAPGTIKSSKQSTQVEG